MSMEGHLLVSLAMSFAFGKAEFTRTPQPCLLCGAWKSPRVAAVLFGVLLLPISSSVGSHQLLCGSPSAPLPSPCAVTQWGHGNDAPHVSQPDFLLCLQL